MPTHTYQDQARDKFHERVGPNKCTRGSYDSPLSGLPCYCKNKS